MKKKTAKIFKLDSTKNKKNRDTSSLTLEEFEKIMDKINEEVDFLPKDSVLLLPLMQPLLKEAGMDEKKLERCLFSTNPNEDDVEILQWAVEIAYCLTDASSEDDDEEWELLMDEAIEIAADFVPRLKAKPIIYELEAMFRHIKSEGEKLF